MIPRAGTGVNAPANDSLGRRPTIGKTSLFRKSRCAAQATESRQQRTFQDTTQLVLRATIHANCSMGSGDADALEPHRRNQRFHPARNLRRRAWLPGLHRPTGSYPARQRPHGYGGCPPPLVEPRDTRGNSQRVLQNLMAYRSRFGRWPKKHCGRIVGSLGETWLAVDKALMNRGRGLSIPGMTLARLLAEQRSVLYQRSLRR